MKTILRGIAFFLVCGMVLATDGVEAQYGMMTWCIGAAASLGAAALLVWIADLLPDKPRRRRRRRKAGERNAQRYA